VSEPRWVVWFSCGAASTTAASIVLKDHPDAILAYCDTGSEHPDNSRFLADVERWLGVKVLVLKSEKYRDVWQVFKERRYLSGPKGALCTTEMKKIPRFAFQQPDDIQVFGYVAGEEKRAARFREQNFDVDMRAPLIDAGITKADCLETIRRAGIEIPAMYKMGYRNNNCIGCVKGGAGYWNKIRRDFPDVFARMAAQERELNASILRKKGERLFLDVLPPKMGRYETEPDITCGLLCEAPKHEPEVEVEK
jgi:3'-phosphoadenosine 5'-phosphosulfate sulfotransferase (PAPS reductase)/FAD synthetase